MKAILAAIVLVSGSAALSSDLPWEESVGGKWFFLRPEVGSDGPYPAVDARYQEEIDLLRGACDRSGGRFEHTEAPEVNCQYVSSELGWECAVKGFAFCF